MRYALTFAIVLAVFILGPPFLPGTFGPYPQLRWGDVLDLATPLVVLPAAWLLFRSARVERPTAAETFVFVALAAIWAEGQGMHLAANAIGHLVGEGTGDLQTLTHDLDENLSHLLWHGALIGLSALIVRRSLRGDAAAAPGSRVALGLAAALFGFTFFAMVVEGGTAVIGLPGAALAAVNGLVVARKSLLRRPAAAFFTLGFLLALALCLVWAALNGWQLIEFSQAGLID